MTLEKKLLYHFVRDALMPYSEDFTIHAKGNPVVIQLNGKSHSIHISYVHDSGNSRPNPDEVRIQISRSLIDKQRQHSASGRNVAFLGFFSGGKTFIAWDPRHIFSTQSTTMLSVYARQSQEARVAQEFAATHQFKAQFLQETSFAIALPSNALGFYLENIEHFHRLQSEERIQSLIRDHDAVLADNILGINGSFEIEQDGERERFTYMRKSFPRDPKFKKHVLAVYNRTCCICNRQLALVQAAHIIPHSKSDSPNTISNGLALCIEHHRLYDDALLLPGPGQRLVFNNERAEYLRQTRQERGLNEIATQHDTKFTIPRNPEFQPSDEYLQRGLEIRIGE